MGEPPPETIPNHLREAFRDAVCGYSDWIPARPELEVRIGSTLHSLSEVCALVDHFHDQLPEDVLDKLMAYMRGVRYTLLRQKLVADQSYAAGARCFLRLLEDCKRYGETQ
jgi:hypothetical protein